MQLNRTRIAGFQTLRREGLLLQSFLPKLNARIPPQAGCTRFLMVLLPLLSAGGQQLRRSVKLKGVRNEEGYTQDSIPPEWDSTHYTISALHRLPSTLSGKVGTCGKEGVAEEFT